MRLPDDERAASYRASGAWGRVPLDMLVHRTAQSSGERLALADPDDRGEWTGGAPRRLSYRELDDEIERQAAELRGLGLPPSSVIALFSPATTDSVVLLLAVMRAGYIAAHLPLAWRGAEIIPALDCVGAKAIIAADRLENERLAEIARDTAIELFGVRYVLGLGDDLPDGVASLSSLAGVSGAEEASHDRSDADRIATVTWSSSPDDAPLPVPRSHNQWVAAGLMHLLEGRLETGAAIHSAFAMTGIVGLGAVLSSWLLSGGTLYLHHFRTLEGLADDVTRSGARHVVLPEILVDPLAASLEKRGADMPSISAVWRHGMNNLEAAAGSATSAQVDIVPFDEFALVAAWRDDAHAILDIPVGDIAAPHGAHGAPVLLETRLTARAVAASDERGDLLQGEVSVAGAMVPSVHWPGNGATEFDADDAGFLRSGVLARISSQDPPMATICGLIPGYVHIGAEKLRFDTLDDVFSARLGTGMAAAFVADDPVMGGRLEVAIADASADTPETAFGSYFQEMRIGLHRIPTAIRSVDSLPTKDDGAPDRLALSRTTAQSG